MIRTSAPPASEAAVFTACVCVQWTPQDATCQLGSHWDGGRGEACPLHHHVERGSNSSDFIGIQFIEAAANPRPGRVISLRSDTGRKRTERKS